MADAGRGLDIIRARSETIEGLTYWSAGAPRRAGRQSDLVHLIPIYDEYVVAYRDRIAVPHGTLFRHFVVINGQIAGGWQPGREGRVTVTPARRLTRREQKAAKGAAERYAHFVSG